MPRRNYRRFLAVWSLCVFSQHNHYLFYLYLCTNLHRVKWIESPLERINTHTVYIFDLLLQVMGIFAGFVLLLLVASPISAPGYTIFPFLQM